MDFPAIYYDGLVADPQKVTVQIEELDQKYIDPKSPEYLVDYSSEITIVDQMRGHDIAHWRGDRIFALPSKAWELRLGADNKLPGARLVFSGSETKNALNSLLPGLAMRKRKNRGRQLKIIALATTALASVALAYVFGIPLIAQRIVELIPPETEVDFGRMVAGQMSEALSEQGGIPVCDTDPGSVANLAITRFAQQALVGIDTPFEVNIQVVNNSIPNAFALPGGQAYYFAGLLEKTENANEFSAVLAHEIGHVVARHSMQKLVSTAGTGLLVGFILGDITGLSVAGSLGSVLINNSFSREAEREADDFALEIANRMNFEASGLANLLDRISREGDTANAFALFSTHPLNIERRQALEISSQSPSIGPAAFSQKEWVAIKAMCANSAVETGPGTKSTKIKS